MLLSELPPAAAMPHTTMSLRWVATVTASTVTPAPVTFAPVIHRFHTYAIAVEPPQVQAYMETMMALPAFQEWTRAGLAETLIIERVENA